MADMYTAGDPPLQSQTETPVKDSDLPAYRYARALCESARNASAPVRSRFKGNWNKLLGKGYWESPQTQAARQLDAWMFKGLVNWMFATIKTKAAMVTGAEADVFVEPLDEDSSYLQRLQWKSVLEHEFERVGLERYGYKAYMSGSVTSVGITMWTAKPDPLTGAMALSLVPIRSEDFFCDPSADSIKSTSCRYVVWEPELDMSTIREMWPDKAAQVKPDVRVVTGNFNYRADDSGTNMIYGTGGEFSVDSRDTLSSRKAKVSFVWIRDESVVEELQTTILSPEADGLQCDNCGQLYEQGAIHGELSAGAACPTCGGTLEPTKIPAKTQQHRVVRRAYPYGRLIAYSGDTLLYDGENPYEIEGVFPFFVYHHEILGDGNFYGGNDVDLLYSLQDAENRTLGQHVDYVRLAVNGPVLYPVAYKAITEMGNTPGQRLPGPNQLPWPPRILAPEGFNVQAVEALYQALDRHFQIVSGLGSIGFSQTSSPPVSATEAEIANARLTDRMKAHAEAYSEYLSDGASIGQQMMVQFYDEPMTRAISMPDSEIKAIEIEVQKLPKVKVRVSIDTKQTVRDKLAGQVMATLATPGPTGQAPLDGPYGDILAESSGALSSNQVKELMARRSLHQEMAPPGSPAPMGLPGAPPLSLVPPPPPNQQGGM